MQFLRILFRLIFVLNETENRGYWYECIQYVFMNIVSIIIVLEMGFPFVKSGGFLNCPPGMSQIGNFLCKMSLITVEYCSPDVPLRMYFLNIFSFVIICLHLQVYN